MYADSVTSLFLSASVFSGALLFIVIFVAMAKMSLGEIIGIES